MRRVVDGLGPAELVARADEEASSIAWLVRHVTRVPDDHVADAFGVEQVRTAQGWAERLALPRPASDTGDGRRSQDLAAVTVSDGDLQHAGQTALVRGLLAWGLRLSRERVARGRA